MLLAFLLVICLVPIKAQQQNSLLKIGRVKYSGGGDWYNDQSSEVNLLAYIRKHTTIQVEPKYEYVDISSDNIFQYPILFMTGHGTVSFSDNEVARLKAYLEHGGFLYIDDDYGMDASIRKEMKRCFHHKILSIYPLIILFIHHILFFQMVCQKYMNMMQKYLRDLAFSIMVSSVCSIQ